MMELLKEKITKLLQKATTKSKTLQFEMHIPTLSLDLVYSSTLPTQQFHSASVGKLFTTTLIFQAIEKGLAKLDTRITTILPSAMLNGLFDVDGHDYRDDVTIAHLLGHTSGVNDYFEGKTTDGVSFLDQVIRNPKKHFTPADLLDFTRNHQRAIGSPGQTYLYSDTGFELLGMIVESLYVMPFHQALETQIFVPLHLTETTMCFFSPGFDASKLAPIFIKKTDVRTFESLSCDHAGGGLSTTTGDLTKFLNGLANHTLLSDSSLQAMTQFNNHFLLGMYYGLGMMQLRFEKFFFLLKNLPRLQGHLGVLGVHAWYNPLTKDTFVMNIGDADAVANSFQLLIQIVAMVEQQKQKIALKT